MKRKIKEIIENHIRMAGTTSFISDEALAVQTGTFEDYDEYAVVINDNNGIIGYIAQLISKTKKVKITEDTEMAIYSINNDLEYKDYNYYDEVDEIAQIICDHYYITNGQGLSFDCDGVYYNDGKTMIKITTNKE